MSRLRRPCIARQVFFITNNLLRTRTRLTEADFQALADAMSRVRARRHFLLAGYVLMPDHWHALLMPAENDALPRLMNSLKVASMQAAINGSRHTTGALWQARYYDHVIRNAGEHRGTLEYMHGNPVRKGLVKTAGEWRWPSIHSYGGPGPVRLNVDRVDLLLA
jgi:putative transposase